MEILVAEKESLKTTAETLFEKLKTKKLVEYKTENGHVEYRYVVHFIQIR